MRRVVLLGCLCVWGTVAAEDGAWRLEDRSKIEDLLIRYCTAVDRLDWDLYLTVFAKDATVDYTAAGGATGTAPAMAKWLQMVFQDMPIRLARHQHRLSNIEVFFDKNNSNAAKVRAIFTSPLSLNVFPLEYGPLMTTAGWYHHDVVRNSKGEWKSVSLREEIAYNQATVHSVVFVLAIVFVLTSIVRVLRSKPKQAKLD